jgi:hypothetical protein
MSAIMTPGISTLVVEIGASIVVYAGAYYAFAPSNVNQYIATTFETLR